MPDHSQKTLVTQLTECVAEAVQVRLLFQAVRESVPASQQLSFSSIERRVLDLELRLIELARNHLIHAGAAVTVEAKPQIFQIH